MTSKGPGNRAGTACATDPMFGYEFGRRLIPVLATRLQSTRAKLIARSRGAASTW